MSLIPVKSPLALVGVFLDVLRQRFHPDYGLPWKFTLGDANRNESTMTIEAAGNPLAEELGKRPGIFVQRNPITFSQVTLGDEFHSTMKSGARFYYTTAQTGMTFICEAEEAGEVEVIADIVLSTLMMGADRIEETFVFRKLGPFAISSRAVTRQDVELHQIHVQMGLSYDVRWLNYPIAPILKEVVERVGATYNNGDQYFTEIFQQSLASSQQS